MKVYVLITTINDIDYYDPLDNTHFSLSRYVSQLHGPSTQLQKWNMAKAEARLLDTEIGPEMTLRLKQSQSVSFGEDDTGLTTSNDVNPQLPMATFVTLWKDIPWR